METYRLKKIVIWILILLNLFLAILLLYFYAQQHTSQKKIREELYTLYDSQSISLSEEIDLTKKAPPAVSLSRNHPLEDMLASAILGDEVEGTDEGGGLYTYTNQLGTIQFRSTGAFDYVPASAHTISDPEEFLTEFCETFHYSLQGYQEKATYKTYTVAAYVNDIYVPATTVTIRFDGNRLLSVSGTYISISPSPNSEEAVYSATDALVSFLAYRSEIGVICNAIEELSVVYEPETSASSPMRLLPKWRIQTDANLYYLDAMTGLVSRG